MAQWRTGHLVAPRISPAAAQPRMQDFVLCMLSTLSAATAAALLTRRRKRLQRHPFHEASGSSSATGLWLVRAGALACPCRGGPLESLKLLSGWLEVIALPQQ